LTLPFKQLYFFQLAQKGVIILFLERFSVKQKTSPEIILSEIVLHYEPFCCVISLIVAIVDGCTAIDSDIFRILTGKDQALFSTADKVFFRITVGLYFSFPILFCRSLSCKIFELQKGFSSLPKFCTIFTAIISFALCSSSLLTTFLNGKTPRYCIREALSQFSHYHYKPVFPGNPLKNRTVFIFSLFIRHELSPRCSECLTPAGTCT